MNSKLLNIAQEILDDTIKNRELLESTINQLKQTKDTASLESTLNDLDDIIIDMKKTVKSLEEDSNE